MYDIKHLPGVIELGVTGENTFRTIEINMQPWLEILPDGVASIIHIRPGETADDAYVAATTMTDGILSWTVSEGDLGDNEGYGRLEIILEEAGTTTKRGKSVIVQSYVQAGIVPQSSETPEPQQSWIDQMTELKTATVNAASAAETAQTGAETAEENAEAWAVGQRNGTDVGSSDPTYHNNSKYYSEQSASSSTDAATARTAAETAQGLAEVAQGKAETAQEKAEYAMGKYPQIDSTSGNWETFNPNTQEYTDTGVHAKGDTGEVPDIEVGTVTTLLPGESAYVTRRSGTPDTAPIFDFGIPKGDTGQAGNIYGNTIDMTENDSTKVATAIGYKADKVTSPTNGDFAALDSNGNLTDSGHKHSDYKTAQTAVTDPSASGTTDEFIATISQDANGVITPTKKTVQDATTSVHGLMSASDKSKLNGLSEATLRDVPLAVAVGDWTLSDGVYTANFTSAYITTTCKWHLDWDESYRSYAKDDVNVALKSGGGGLTLTTATIPTGTLVGDVSVIDNDDGKIPVIIEDTTIPVANGGTGQTTVAGVRSAFNIPDVVDNLTTNDGTKALSAAQGKTLSEQIGTLKQIQPSSVSNLISELSTAGDMAIVVATTTFSSEFGTSGWVYGIFTRVNSTRIDFSFSKQTGDFIVGAITISGSSYTISTKNLSGAEKNTGYTIAAKNGCTLNTAKLFWNGSLVTAYIDITIGSTIAIGTQIANGLPSPQGTYDNAVTAVSNSNSNDQIQAFTIDGYGDLKIAGKAATASRRYRMTFTYIVN